MDLKIIFQDEYLVAINKPPGLLVHRTKLANDANVFALQLLRDQIGQHVFPIHRLDRKTSGVLLFALNEDIHKTMQLTFAEKKIKKTYLSIVRGFTEDDDIIDYPLRKDNGIMQDAVTKYKTLGKTEINLPFGRHSTSRYSLLQVQPLTGRKHQIRKHLAHIHHPIIADRPHGCNKQNKLFKEKFGLMTMMLHASQLEFQHPKTDQSTTIKAELHSEFRRMLKELEFKINFPAF
jgi:tRNA pseudouridine65 synthase